MINWQWPEVDKLESEERWNEAKSLLIESWRQNPNDVKILIRLGFFCWYVLVEEGPLKIQNVDMDELDSILKEVTQIGFEHFKTNVDFLWCFGYMISLFPEHFGDNYNDWEEKGRSMLKFVYELHPDDPVYKYTYLGSLSTSINDIKDEFHQLQEVVKERFQGSGLLSSYFKDIWC